MTGAGAARTAGTGGGGYAAHVDYVRRRAVVQGRDSTTFYSWREDGPSVVRNMIEDRFGTGDGQDRQAGELAG